MAAWSPIIRFAPASAVAAAALSHAQACHHKRDGKPQKFDLLGRHTKSPLHCQEVARKSRAGSVALVVPTLGSSEIGLLGQSNWIYRLVNTEDVKKVYHFERALGHGAFATVYLGKHKELGYDRAVKVLPKGRGVEEHEEMMTEIYNLMDLDHPHIIALSRTWDDGDCLYIVSELCSGPSLLDRIIQAPMSEFEAAVALRHMLKAVLCCHSHYMGHYDIKPDNFMYSTADCKKLKMIDLGLSSGFKRDTTQFKGTVAYMAPEVFSGLYGPEADLWSCGVVLFVMATRSSLCPLSLSDEKVASLLQDRHFIKERLAWAADKVSPECHDLLHRMLCCDRHMRITAADALSHPFVVKSYAKPTRRKDQRKEEAALAVIRSMADRFIAYGQEPVLVRAALLIMVHIAGYITTQTKSNRLAFSMLDRAGSGELSMDSIEAMMPQYGLDIPKNLYEAFRAVDLTRTGYITYSHFLSATLPLSLRCREDLCRRVFNLLDQNRDGFLDHDDLEAIFLSVDSREGRSGVRLRQLCRKAIIEISGSPSKTRIRFEDFLLVMVGSNSPIVASGLASSDDES